MTTKVQGNNNKQKGLFNWIKEEAQSSYWLRMIGEFVSAFFFIFIINLVIALGEDSVPIFDFFYNVNIGMGIWVGSMTFLAFLWTQRTTLSANFVNLVINYRNNNINRKEFYGSMGFQFIGGFFAATIVYIIAGCFIHTNDPAYIHIMGGTTPKIKSLFLSNPNLPDTIFSSNNPIYNPIDFTKGFKTGYAYLWAAVQGCINAIWIIVAFILNGLVDKKYENGRKSIIWRYIILVVGVSITTIFYANTTNWVRLLSPAVVSTIVHAINGHSITESTFLLSTTITYIAFQTIGLIVVYFTTIHRNEEEK